MAAPFDLLLRNVRIASCADDACAVSPTGFVAILCGWFTAGSTNVSVR